MTRRPVGELLKEWRTRRRRSQLDLALDANISQRHLSFVESGRSTPSRDMVIHLSEKLDIPLRERNVLLLSAGFAPMYLMRALDDPSLCAARAAIELLLERQAPSPAIAIDRHWNVVGLNSATQTLLQALVAPKLLERPNVLRLSLHPDGLAPRIKNLYQWRGHLLKRLREQIEITADPILADMHAELELLPMPEGAEPQPTNEAQDVFIPLILDTPMGRLSFLSVTTVFGTPNDITLAEIAIESFFPADEDTIAALRAASSIT